MKIGVLGGTFDPIHNGHLILAETAREAAGLDFVMLVPTGCSYFKEDQKITDAHTRYEMTCLAAKDNPGLLVTDLETNRPGNSYTAETLQALSEKYPNDKLYYIVGADTLVMMSLWKDPQKIFDNCEILVSVRSDQVDASGLKEEMQRLREEFNAKIHLLPVRNIEISSSDIRQRIKNGRSVRYLVPESVRTFMKEHNLYHSLDGEKE